MVHCGKCGIVPVKESDLPVKLPDDVNFDVPGNPLDHHPTWKHVPAVLRQPRDARHRHARHVCGFLLVFRALLRPASAPVDARRRITGCRSISISAASSTRSCICSMPASSRAP
jgi:hypothetical protein